MLIQFLTLLGVNVNLGISMTEAATRVECLAQLVDLARGTVNPLSSEMCRAIKMVKSRPGPCPGTWLPQQAPCWMGLHDLVVCCNAKL